MGAPDRSNVYEVTWKGTVTVTYWLLVLKPYWSYTFEGMYVTYLSLRSKRFQSSYSAKVGAGAKKKWKGKGEGRRGNTCPQTPRYLENAP